MGVCSNLTKWLRGGVVFAVAGAALPISLCEPVSELTGANRSASPRRCRRPGSSLCAAEFIMEARHSEELPIKSQPLVLLRQ